MLKVTPDTNILISAAISKGNQSQLLKLAHEGKIQLILSPQILEEFAGVISREKFGFSSEQREKAVKQLMSISQIVLPLSKINVIKEDPQDNKVLECAESGKVNYLVSGDNHLLKLKEYQGIKIVKTSELLRVIEGK